MISHNLIFFSVFQYHAALRTPTEGKPLGTCNRSIRESRRVKGLRSKLSPKEGIRNKTTKYDLAKRAGHLAYVFKGLLSGV